MFLQLSWLFLLQSISLPGVLLWFELIGLIMVLLLGFTGVGAAGTATG